jgi:phosphate transport system permease protein
MIVEAPAESRGIASPAAPKGTGGDRPLRLQRIHVDDAILFAGAALASFCLAWLLYVALTPQATVEGFGVWWFVVFLVMYWLAVRRMEGRLIARDRVWTVLITGGATVVVVPLVLVVIFVVYKGIGTLTPHFFVETDNICGQLSAPTCGGVGHAIVGTLEEVGIAILFAVPLGVLCAVFLNEIGGPLKRPVRLIVDAMSGVPSIVAGLFIYAVWVVGLNKGFSGFGAALALSILMLPTITRTSEEVLRLVPGGLREGALALGASEWRTVWGVVLPTARSGLITAAILGVARGVGETAPLILTSFGSSVFNADPFSGPQEALPHYIYEYIRYNPGTGPYQRAWSAAVVLIVLVLGLFTLARVLGARTSIEGRQRRAMKRTVKRRDAAAADEINLKGVRNG